MKNKITPFLCSALLLTGCANAISVSEESQVNSNETNNNYQVLEEEKEPVQSEEPLTFEEEEENDDLLENDMPEIQMTPGYVKIEPLELMVRTSEATITDSGRVNQKMDTVYLDYDYEALASLGYIYLDITVSFEAREVYDGYQYLFLYNTKDCQSSAESLAENFVPAAGDSINQGMLIKEQFEIGPGYRKTDWEYRSFHYVIQTNYMKDDLYLRYGANGILEDTWVNRNVKVVVQPTQTKNA